MGSGISGRYSGTLGSSEPKSGVNYNRAGSKEVGEVETIIIGNNSHAVPIKSEPNSVFQKIVNGKIREERYYNSKGEPYLDIDYTDHGRPDIHTNPHQHIIRYKKGKFTRKERSIIK
ncbi:hypothetical protein IJH02_03860 [Candidatus Saccharibacteria bacterium]|nr:hypothetical protein [Candidatus Saccharibacteria bacterium]